MKTNVNTIENNEIKEITEVEEPNTDVIEDITEVEDLNTSENLNELRRLLIQSIGYEETPTDEALFTDLLDKIMTKTQAIEKIYELNKRSYSISEHNKIDTSNPLELISILSRKLEQVKVNSNKIAEILDELT